MKRALQAGLILSLSLVSISLSAFQPLRSSTGAAIHWEGSTVSYLINKNGTSSPCISDVFTTLNDAFNVWHSVSTQVLDVQYGGTTSNSNFCGMDRKGTGCDSKNVVVFVGSGFPYGVLAMTVNYYRIADGVILGTDMAFNDGLNWSDDPLADPNLACRGENFYSLSAVAVHEIGHFYGLDHSFCTDVGSVFDPAIATTMYPYYFDNAYWTDMVSLEQDDLAGVTWLYPDPSLTGWGTIKGTVKYNNGAGLFGVQVTAIRSSDKVPIVTTFTRSGKYTLFGLLPGDYYVYVNTPRIGRLYTAYVSDYWHSTDIVPYILLYKQLKVKTKSGLGPGGTAFTKSAAKVITVVADTARTKVNFTYPAP